MLVVAELAGNVCGLAVVLVHVVVVAPFAIARGCFTRLVRVAL